MLQRGLILLTSHLEDFRKRYAFHLRNWRLIGCGINSHQKSLADKNSSLIRITLQPGGSSEKVGTSPLQRNELLCLDKF